MTPSPAKPAPADVVRLYEAIRVEAQRAAVFGVVRVVDGRRLECAALESAEPAFYRVEFDGDRLWVSLVTDNRWLSQSIEADLVHTGDKLEDLIDEELVALGFEGGPLPMEHFRSEDKLFTFRSPLPIEPSRAADPEAVRTATLCLLGYEAAFRELGDMSGGEEER